MLVRTSVKNFTSKEAAMDYILGLPDDILIRVYESMLDVPQIQVCTYRDKL